MNWRRAASASDLRVEGQLVGDVVLVDVADIRGRFDADLLGNDDLDVVEPLVGIEAAPLCFLARLGDVARAAVVARESEQRTIPFTEPRVRESSGS
jgi:hypothetical protein